MKKNYRYLTTYCLIFLAGTAAGAFLSHDLSLPGQKELSSLTKNSSSNSLKEIWDSDLKSLEKNQQLPKQWKEIKEIRYKALSKISANWLGTTSIPIALNNEGKYILNLELDHWIENQKIAAILHFQIVESESGNTVSEFGRTYQLQ